jgi:hypothetical protein
LNADRLSIVSGVDKTRSQFAKNSDPVEAPPALYPELALKPANVIRTNGREGIKLAFERQVSRQIERQPASSSDASRAANPSPYHGELSAHFIFRYLLLGNDGVVEK